MKHRDWHRAWAGLCPPSLHPGYVLVWATGGGGEEQSKTKKFRERGGKLEEKTEKV